MRLRRSPQERKRLSLLKDRRNNYGQSDKGPRAIIPLKKRLGNRRVRRSSAALVIVGRLADEKLDAFESGIKAKTRLRLKMRWRKSPDAPLGAYVESRRKARTLSHGGKKAAQGSFAVAQKALNCTCAAGNSFSRSQQTIRPTRVDRSSRVSTECNTYPNS